MEGEESSLDQRTRQVVILAVGTMWEAPFEVYAHVAAGRAAGLPEAALDALRTGGLAPELSDREQLAWRFARQLSGERRVEDGLYAEARDAFGERGLVDLVMLVGSYLFTSAVLNAFEVPAPAENPKVPRHSAGSSISMPLADGDPAMAEPLILFVRITPKPEHFATVRKALLGIVPATRAEPGCRSFVLHEETWEQPTAQRRRRVSHGQVPHPGDGKARGRSDHQCVVHLGAEMGRDAFDREPNGPQALTTVFPRTWPSRSAA